MPKVMRAPAIRPLRRPTMTAAAGKLLASCGLVSAVRVGTTARAVVAAADDESEVPLGEAVAEVGEAVREATAEDCLQVPSSQS